MHTDYLVILFIWYRINVFSGWLGTWWVESETQHSSTNQKATLQMQQITTFHSMHYMWMEDQLTLISTVSHNCEPPHNYMGMEDQQTNLRFHSNTQLWTITHSKITVSTSDSNEKVVYALNAQTDNASSLVTQVLLTSKGRAHCARWLNWACYRWNWIPSAQKYPPKWAASSEKSNWITLSLSNG